MLATTITLLPIWESRQSLAKFARYIFSGKITRNGPAVVTLGVIEDSGVESGVEGVVHEKNGVDKS